MAVTCIDSRVGESYALYNGDCCEVLEAIPDGSIGHSIFSPPFADLYCYSDNERDMGNCRGMDDFMAHFGVLIGHLARVMQNGRIVAVHCMDIPAMKERDGFIGLKDFPGEIIRAFQAHGFIFHSRVCIPKDPLIEATRTKAIGLMHKQLLKDSTMSRMGIADYIVAMRKPGQNADPVSHGDGLSEYAGSHDPGGVGVKRSHNIWRAYASPVWDDIRQTRTLNGTRARDEEDEKHICPLQLDTIERCITLWSNPGNTVLTPFMGIGSEAFCAVRMGRKAVGVELKESYFRQAVKNVSEAETLKDQFAGTLFDGTEDADA